MEKVITQYKDVLLSETQQITGNKHVETVKDVSKVIGICTVTAAGVYMTYNGAKKEKVEYYNDITEKRLKNGKFIVATGVDIPIKLNYNKLIT